jgi:hypothetical protein
MENNQKNCLIANSKRLRVGGNGPSRKELLPFAKIGTVPESIINELLIIPTAMTVNDLGGDNYQISKHCDLETVFNVGAGYRQVLLQSKLSDNSDIDEFAYTEWNTIVNNNIKNFLYEKFNNIYRFRLSIMSENHELNWHIDTDPSVMCRAQLCLSDTDAEFEFKTKAGVQTLIMERGGLYFINVGWSHRVVNTSKSERIVAIFGFEFKDMLPENQMLVRLGGSTIISNHLDQVG